MILNKIIEPIISLYLRWSGENNPMIERMRASIPMFPPNSKSVFNISVFALGTRKVKKLLGGKDPNVANSKFSCLRFVSERNSKKGMSCTEETPNEKRGI